MLFVTPCTSWYYWWNCSLGHKNPCFLRLSPTSVHEYQLPTAWTVSDFPVYEATCKKIVSSTTKKQHGTISSSPQLQGWMCGSHQGCTVCDFILCCMWWSQLAGGFGHRATFEKTTIFSQCSVGELTTTPRASKGNVLVIVFWTHFWLNHGRKIKVEQQIVLDSRGQKDS